jgi:hypothetical protein
MNAIAARLVFGLVAGMTLPSLHAREDREQREVVPRITDVAFDLSEKEHKLTVYAVGQVPTAGWTEVKLTRLPARKPPKDGVYEYELTAVPPAGKAKPTATLLSASNEWKDPPADLAAIRVHGVGDGIRTMRLAQR